MRTFLILVVTFSLSCFSQDNYFVNYGNLSLLQQAHDSGYLGIDSANNLVKVNSNFEVEWALGPFDCAIEDLHVEQFGQVYVLGRNGAEVRLTVVSELGGVISESKLTFDSYVNGLFERTSSGFVFAFLGINPETNPAGSIVLAKTDLGLNFEWVKTIDPVPGPGIGLSDLEVRGDTITLLHHHGNGSVYANILSRYSLDGDHLWSKHIGSDCSYYRDFTELTTGEFVLTGEGTDPDYWETFKLTVLSNDGELLSTKERHYSDTDSETDVPYVIGLSDGRYVVSLEFYEDMGGGLNGAIIYFDNHKPIKHWCFQPFDVGGDMGESFRVWSADANDQLLFSGFVYSNDIDTSEYVMGRMTWLSEACGVGYQTDYLLGYGLEPSEAFSPTLNDITLAAFSVYTGSLAPTTYSNLFKCSNTAVDPGPLVTDNHLYGTAGGSCPFTMYGSAEVEEPISTAEFRIYPNPAYSNFVIKSDAEGELTLLDIRGKILWQVAVSAKEKVDVATLDAGLYLVEFATTDGRTLRQSLVKY